MYKALIGTACAVVIASGAVYINGERAKAAAYRDVAAYTSERDRCAAVLVDWARGIASDGKMAFCQVDGLVSEADMKQALAAN